MEDVKATSSALETGMSSSRITHNIFKVLYLFSFLSDRFSLTSVCLYFTELYFLIARFLSAGPCTEAAKVC